MLYSNSVVSKQGASHQYLTGKMDCLCEVSDDRKVGIVTKRNDLFVDHESKDSHHGGTSVVEFDRSLLDLGLFVELVPSEVEGTVAVVTDEFGFVVEPFGVTVDNGGDGEEGKHLEEDVLSVLGGQEVVEGLESGRDISGTGESNSGGGDEVSGDGKHGNTSVGDFVLPEKVEFLLGTVLDESERIEESELW